jgi:two-component system cell cycle sensor histidine kinase/response regulator CckA
MRPPKKILVVDDSPDVLLLVGRILESRGYVVSQAGSGQEALASCHGVNGEIDLILTDVTMPRMDGIQLAGLVTTCYPKINVLYMSGQFDGQLQNEVSEKAFGFLSKPFMPDALIEAVERIVGKANRPEQKAAKAQPSNPNEKTA